jgi:hypothetical protein
LLILCFASFERHALQTRGSYFVYELSATRYKRAEAILYMSASRKTTRYKRAGAKGDALQTRRNGVRWQKTKARQILSGLVIAYFMLCWF